MPPYQMSIGFVPGDDSTEPYLEFQIVDVLPNVWMALVMQLTTNSDFARGGDFTVCGMGTIRCRANKEDIAAGLRKAVDLLLAACEVVGLKLHDNQRADAPPCYCANRFQAHLLQHPPLGCVLPGF